VFWLKKHWFHLTFLLLCLVRVGHYFYDVQGGLICIRERVFTSSRESSETPIAVPGSFFSTTAYRVRGVLFVFREKVDLFKKLTTLLVRRSLPSPHSELLLGSTLGINDLSLVPRFNDVVVVTGTIHVIVVSGYNISLVSGMVTRALGSKYRRKNFIIASLGTFVYAVISGFEPPVIRAWIMGTIASYGTFLGRKNDIVGVLFVSAESMLLVQPAFICSLSFQLSFLATLSLLFFSFAVSRVLSFINKSRLGRLFYQDLVATVSAQILVLPLIAFSFGRISLVSFVANALLLWTVPLATVYGLALLAVLYLSYFLNFWPFVFLAKIISAFVFVFLDIFIRGVYFFAAVPYANIDFKMPLRVLLMYYFACFLVVLAPKFFSRLKIFSSEKA